MVDIRCTHQAITRKKRRRGGNIEYGVPQLWLPRNWDRSNIIRLRMEWLASYGLCKKKKEKELVTTRRTGEACNSIRGAIHDAISRFIVVVAVAASYIIAANIWGCFFFPLPIISGASTKNSVHHLNGWKKNAFLPYLVSRCGMKVGMDLKLMTVEALAHDSSVGLNSGGSFLDRKRGKNWVSSFSLMGKWDCPFLYRTVGRSQILSRHRIQSSSDWWLG